MPRPRGLHFSIPQFLNFSIPPPGVSSMIVGSGVDLAEVSRIRQAIERFGERFLTRVYTPGERAYVGRKKNQYEGYAARFAAKEAGMKAIGTGWKRGVTWQDLEVV